MRIIEEHFIDNFDDLKNLCWGGALDTLKDIENADKEEEFMQYLEEAFCDDEEITDTSINDYIHYESDEIYETLGLDENGKLIEEEEEEEE